MTGANKPKKICVCVCDCDASLICLAHSLFVPAEDGALLGKIEKVRVLRNDRREGNEGVIIHFHPHALIILVVLYL